MFRFFSHIFNTFDKHLFTGISMVICKIGWSIRSWLSDYISFSFYKSYCRHDIYWILVAFMIAASALIKVSRLYGLYRHLYTQLIYWHCAVILYTYVNLLNKRFWILNPESFVSCDRGWPPLATLGDTRTAYRQLPAPLILPLSLKLWQHATRPITVYTSK